MTKSRGGEVVVERLTLREARAKDEKEVSRLLWVNAMPGKPVPEGRFVVAEERGEVLATVGCRAKRGSLVLGPLAMDPLVNEYRFAVALYSGAKLLARGMEMREVWADADEHREYLLEAGYARRVGGWRIFVERRSSRRRRRVRFFPRALELLDRGAATVGDRARGGDGEGKA